MTLHLKLGRPLLATAWLAGCVLVGAGPARAADIPFRADLSGSIAFTGPSTVEWSVSGQATHLGRTTAVGDIQLTGPDSSCPGGVANVNTVTLTAANGDTLVLTSTDVACPIGPNQYHGSGTWTVTGGTGRFAGATGSGWADGRSDFNAGTFVATYTGSLVR